MKQLFKALDAGFTAFCNELWLPTFGFHLFDDPADALEDDVRPCHMCDETCGVCRDAVLDERAKRVVDVPVELAGSLGAPGDSPPAAHSPEAAAGGHPLNDLKLFLDKDLLYDAARACWWVADNTELATCGEHEWDELAKQLFQLRTFTK